MPSLSLKLGDAIVLPPEIDASELSEWEQKLAKIEKG